MLGLTLQEIEKCEIQAAESLMQLQEMKRKLMEACNMEESKNKAYEDREVPLVAYEMQLERFHEEKREIAEREDREKDKIRAAAEKDKERLKKIIAWLAGVLAILIIGGIGTAVWFFGAHEFATYEQNADYGNANFIGNDGDIVNGKAENPSNSSEVPQS